MKGVCFGMDRHAAGRGGVIAGLVAIAALLTALPAHAKDEPDPLTKLRRTDAEIRAAVNQRLPDWSPEVPVRQMRIDRLLRSLLDYEAIARRALGGAFETLTPERRHAFVTTLSALTGQTFLAKMQDQKTRTVYDRQTIQGSEARVMARAGARDAPPDSGIHVEYLLSRRDSVWLVTDVVIDGTSLVASYEQQFRPLVEREGLDGLMARMRDRLTPPRN
jgi:phospholipid transport system substrate-binding protein